jgi:hypothetical protein
MKLSTTPLVLCLLGLAVNAQWEGTDGATANML